MSCKNCKNWTRQKDTDWYKDMGRCAKLSASKGEDYPNLDITGIESTPLCPHDGVGTEYETKKWFSCMHFDAVKKGKNVTDSLALKELEKLISKYDADHSHVGIVTCDTNDVWRWIDEVKEKLNIET